MKNATVLIIEDDESIRQMYDDAFTNAGLKTCTAENGRVGLQLALKHHPAVILVDIMMPEMDGHETVKRIRMDSWGRDAKIIFLTNFSDPKDVVTAFKQKPEKYILKANTSINEIINIVKTAMNS